MQVATTAFLFFFIDCFHIINTINMENDYKCNSFPAAMEEALINAVKEKSCLFDLASPLYKNVTQKDIMWQEIGLETFWIKPKASFSISGDTCRRKWKMLRDTYRRTKRTQILASGSGKVSRQKWRHFDAMKFLDRTQNTTSTTGNLVEDDTLLQSTSLPASPAPTTSARSSNASTRYRQIQEDFGAVASQISASAHIISQRFAKENTRADMAFSGFARLINAAQMPAEIEAALINEVHAVIFTALHNYQPHNN